MVNEHCTKNEVVHYGFLQEIGPNPQDTMNLVIFIEEILNGKLHFLCSKSTNEILNSKTKLLNKYYCTCF